VLIGIKVKKILEKNYVLSYDELELVRFIINYKIEQKKLMIFQLLKINLLSHIEKRLLSIFFK
jgi:hypothetical protein